MDDLNETNSSIRVDVVVYFMCNAEHCNSKQDVLGLIVANECLKIDHLHHPSSTLK